MKITKAMVLGAGKGSRLAPLTDTTPKPLIAVGNEPVIFRTLRLLANVGVTEVIINTHHLAEKLENAIIAGLKSGDIPKMEVYFSREKELLETGGGIKKVLPFFGDEPFFVINGDVVWLEETAPALQNLAAEFNPDMMDAMLLVTPTKRAKRFRKNGDFTRSKTGELNWPKGEDAAQFAPFIYTGIQVTHAPALAWGKGDKFSLSTCLQQLAQTGRLHSVIYDSPWVDMGTPDGLSYANHMLTMLSMFGGKKIA